MTNVSAARARHPSGSGGSRSERKRSGPILRELFHVPSDSVLSPRSVAARRLPIHLQNVPQRNTALACQTVRTVRRQARALAPMFAVCWLGLFAARRHLALARAALKIHV